MSDTLALPARRQQTASHRSSEELWQSTLVRVIRIALEVVSAKVRGKHVPCVGFFTLLSVLRSCVIARVLLLSWDGCCLSLRSCSPFTWLPLARVRALPRSPGGRSCRGVLEPPSPRSLFTHACRLLCCWSVSTSVCDHVRAHSGVEHTGAVSTGTVRDPREQPSSSPRSTSSRSPFITGSSCSSSSPGVLLPLSARGLTRDQSSRRVPSHPLHSLTASNLFSRLDFSSQRSAESNLHRLDLGTQELFRVLFQWRV